MLFLLSGVRLDEAINLRWSDVDFVNSRIHVGDEPRRDVDMTVALSEALAARPRAAESELVLYQPGVPVTRDAVEAQITCAALDAGIEDATQVNSDCLWHTYVAYLVRQGVRFSHLMRLVGDLSAEVVRNYSALSPGGSRAEERKVDVLLPALRDWSAGSST
jgi:site-specific recombinase XerD